jgi:hypothetical protein
VCASVEQPAHGHHPELRRQALRALVQGLLGSCTKRFDFALKWGWEELLEHLLGGQNVNQMQTASERGCERCGSTYRPVSGGGKVRRCNDELKSSHRPQLAGREIMPSERAADNSFITAARQTGVARSRAIRRLRSSRRRLICRDRSAPVRSATRVRQSGVLSFVARRCSQPKRNTDSTCVGHDSLISYFVDRLNLNFDIRSQIEKTDSSRQYSSLVRWLPDFYPPHR